MKRRNIRSAAICGKDLTTKRSNPWLAPSPSRSTPSPPGTEEIGLMPTNNSVPIPSPLTFDTIRLLLDSRSPNYHQGKYFPNQSHAILVHSFPYHSKSLFQSIVIINAHLWRTYWIWFPENHKKSRLITDHKLTNCLIKAAANISSWKDPQLPWSRFWLVHQSIDIFLAKIPKQKPKFDNLISKSWHLTTYLSLNQTRAIILSQFQNCYLSPRRVVQIGQYFLLVWDSNCVH